VAGVAARREVVCRRSGGHRARRHDDGGEAHPGPRADRHREQARVRGVPAGAGRARLPDARRAAGRPRRRQGPERGRARRIRGDRPDPALPVRQLGRELEQHNASAARSLEEGLEETLTLHRLEVFMKLGISFKTTNLIESVMARVEAKTRRITRWRTSDQKQRWCAATLLEIEKQFRKVKGHQHLGLLQAALRGKLSSPPAAA